MSLSSYLETHVIYRQNKSWSFWQPPKVYNRWDLLRNFKSISKTIVERIVLVIQLLVGAVIIYLQLSAIINYHIAVAYRWCEAMLNIFWIAINGEIGFGRV